MAMTSSSIHRSSCPMNAQPVVQTVLTRDDVRLSCILHRLQRTGLADAVLACRGGESDAPHLIIVSDTVSLDNRAMTAPTAA